MTPEELATRCLDHNTAEEVEAWMVPADLKARIRDAIREAVAAEREVWLAVASTSAVASHRLIGDDDGHWYVILADEADAFRRWCDAAPYWEDYVGKDFSTCRVDGPHSVAFPSWKELS
jgi:hypothetical protein